MPEINEAGAIIFHLKNVKDLLGISKRDVQIKRFWYFVRMAYNRLQRGLWFCL